MKLRKFQITFSIIVLIKNFEEMFKILVQNLNYDSKCFHIINKHCLYRIKS